jgi:hypothetical protein
MYSETSLHREPAINGEFVQSREYAVKINIKLPPVNRNCVARDVDDA